MKLSVIIPVGPGHDDLAHDAVESAIAAGNGKFSEVNYVMVDDTRGTLGRSKARNIGMYKCHADWYFFLDADDRASPDFTALCDFESPATFGAVSLLTKSDVTWIDIQPCGWKEVAEYGSAGTLSMGFFCEAKTARLLRFNEEMNFGEDFDFYLRLKKFTKIDKPLVTIGYDLPSAGGPRGYDEIDWVGICNERIRKAVKENPEKYDLGDNAVLGKAPRSYDKSQHVRRALPKVEIRDHCSGRRFPDTGPF